MYALIFYPIFQSNDAHPSQHSHFYYAHGFGYVSQMTKILTNRRITMEVKLCERINSLFSNLTIHFSSHICNETASNLYSKIIYLLALNFICKKRKKILFLSFLPTPKVHSRLASDYCNSDYCNLDKQKLAFIMLQVFICSSDYELEFSLLCFNY